MNRLLVCLIAATITGCASGKGLTVAVAGETAAVQAIHVAISAEQSAAKTGVIPSAQHAKDLAAFQQVIEAEKALNDALIAWGNLPVGAPVPTIVTTAIADLSVVLADLAPLLSSNPTIGPVLADVSAAVNALSTPGGK